MGWAWAAAAVALVALLPGLGPTALGLRLPDLAGLGGRIGADLRQEFTGEEALESIAGLVVGLVLAVLIIAVVVRLAGRVERDRRDRSERGDRSAPGGPPLVGAAALDPMLPRTARGRRGWAILSVTAGITEEITYRGLLVLTLAVLLPSAGPPAVVLVAAVLFGLAHAYQGPAGILVTGIAGVVFTGMYLATGSLLVPMLVHVLVDLRALLVRPSGDRTVADGVPA